MEKTLNFEYLNKDSLLSSVTVDLVNNDVKVINYTDDVMRQFMGVCAPTVNNVMKFLEMRCFPRTRYDCKELLKTIGLQEYNPLDIVRITHGRMVNDFFWIRFQGEDLSWCDLRCNILDHGNTKKIEDSI